MTFEEKFPRLKGFIQDVEVPNYTYKMVDIDDIQEHCLDKQKVREAIESYFFFEPSTGYATDMKNYLIRGLGLTDDENK